MLARDRTRIINPSKKRKWFFWTGMASVTFSIILFTMMIALGKTQSFIFSQWYQFFIPIPAFFGGQVSGWTTVGREVDMIRDDEQKWTPQQWMTLAGITIGLVAGISIAITRFSLNVMTAGVSEVVVEVLNAAASILGSVGSFAGIASRLESCIVKPKQYLIGGIRGILASIASAFNEKRKSVIAGLLVGLGTSITLWFTGNAALTIVVGVTSFFTGGAAIPLWVAGGLFCLGYIGTNASSFDYLSKMACYYRVLLFNDKQAEADIGEKFHEYQATAIGVTIGLAVATALVIMLLVTQPYLTALIGAMAVTLVCTTTFGSFFSHIGTLVDINCCSRYPHKMIVDSAETMSSAKIAASLSACPTYIAESDKTPGHTTHIKTSLFEKITRVPSATNELSFVKPIF